MKKSFALIMLLFSVLCVYASSEAPHAGIRSIWVHAHNMTDSVNFSHDLNNIRFYLNNTENLPLDSVEYRIQLSGVDRDWIRPVEGNWHFYSDLEAGDYFFQVQCRLKDGVWGATASHRFKIHNPWWRSTPAVLAYVIVLSTIVAYIVYLLHARIKIRNQLLVERKNQQFKNELVLHASREFRAPLSIIRTIIEKLKSENDCLSANDVRYLRTSSRSLMAMIEQLAGYGEASAEPVNIQKEEIDEKDNESTPVNQDIKVLIAVQHTQLAEVIKRDMQESFVVILSAGNDLMRNIEENRPDALVLDTDIPDINAYKVLHRLKANTKTNSIAVILISTFDSSRSLLKAIRSEADDYIAKPFSCEVLTALVMKSIKSVRERNYAACSDEVQSHPRKVYERRADKQFLSNLEKTVNAHMGDCAFDVNALAEAMGITRIQLYNRLKDLTDMTPVEFLRNRRLEKAASLLRDSELSVKEVRDMVGMPDATNFHRRFKEKFGVSPGSLK